MDWSGDTRLNQSVDELLGEENLKAPPVILGRPRWPLYLALELPLLALMLWEPGYLGLSVPRTLALRLSLIPVASWLVPRLTVRRLALARTVDGLRLLELNGITGRAKGVLRPVDEAEVQVQQMGAIRPNLGLGDDWYKANPWGLKRLGLAPPLP